MLRLELTDQEANALAQMLDLALKAGGRNVVMPFMAIDTKIRQAAQSSRKGVNPFEDEEDAEADEA